MMAIDGGLHPAPAAAHVPVHPVTVNVFKMSYGDERLKDRDV
jgi:hypothetical protein